MSITGADSRGQIPDDAAAAAPAIPTRARATRGRITGAKRAARDALDAADTSTSTSRSRACTTRPVKRVRRAAPETAVAATAAHVTAAAQPMLPATATPAAPSPMSLDAATASASTVYLDPSLFAPPAQAVGIPAELLTEIVAMMTTTTYPPTMQHAAMKQSITRLNDFCQWNENYGGDHGHCDIQSLSAEQRQDLLAATGLGRDTVIRAVNDNVLLINGQRYTRDQLSLGINNASNRELAAALNFLTGNQTGSRLVGAAATSATEAAAATLAQRAPVEQQQRGTSELQTPAEYLRGQQLGGGAAAGAASHASASRPAEATRAADTHVDPTLFAREPSPIVSDTTTVEATTADDHRQVAQAQRKTSRSRSGVRQSATAAPAASSAPRKSGRKTNSSRR